MPIEIKILNKRSSGEAPAGKYIARFLDEKSLGPLQALNPCKNAQIIEGIHSGQIVPYDSYVVIGDLPAQADVIEHNEELTERLANAGITIKNLEKYVNERRESWDKERKALEKSLAEGGLMVGELKKENEKLRNGEYAINFAPHIGALKERIQQLEWELESWRNSKKVQLPREVAAELDELIIREISNADIANRFFTANGANKEHYGVSKLLKWTGYGQTEGGKIRVMIFLSALVNGYTEEPEPEKVVLSNIRSEVTEIIKCWMSTPPVADEGNDAERLTNWIFDHFQRHEDHKLPF
ncbi:hypothetical protein [Paenibacillus pseudetheri]|uniref:Uncharacterized protein n=1 Tax=Paenibacillus pseudetheri TaxID=2897682 RepID=A0ABN8FF21_9BACL|nr:hypothetical protein [Paenibacillus pseudetheri]CAH1054064.1 hypothetical protein PAECIP111894_00209 [Paenibacillus pseudetheri]